MNWMITVGVLALALPYLYLMLLVNLNRDDVKRTRKELFECRNFIRKMKFELNSVSIKASLTDIKLRNSEIEKLNEEMKSKYMIQFNDDGFVSVEDVESIKIPKGTVVRPVRREK
jgi:hypothetical protein